jgi:hypothetical protein
MGKRGKEKVKKKHYGRGRYLLKCACKAGFH